MRVISYRVRSVLVRRKRGVRRKYKRNYWDLKGGEKRRCCREKSIATVRQLHGGKSRGSIKR